MKKRRRKKRHYHTGTHRSLKVLGGKLNYRSGWELEVAKFLDTDVSVKCYAYEALAIPYVANTKTGRTRNYYPDFLVSYTDGTRLLVEVKRQDKVNSPVVRKKAAAARVWCEKNGTRYELWTNSTIELIRKQNNSMT